MAGFSAGAHSEGNKFADADWTGVTDALYQLFSQKYAARSIKKKNGYISNI